MNRPNRFLDNQPLEEALRLWYEALGRHGALGPLPAETVPADQALGRVTAEAVFARQSAPFYHGAAMDGIAVRVRETVGASEASPVRLVEGRQFVAVNTGHPLPDGFDAVVMIEDVQPVGEDAVEIVAAATPWQHIRAIGEDIVATELVLPEGQRVRPVDLGALLATGCGEVAVRRQARVAILPTGSELVEPGAPVRPGNIIELNSRIIAGLVAEWGATPWRLPITPDDPARLRQAVACAAAEHDLVLVNAGASAGSEDHTARVLAELGEVVVHGVNIKPGKPVILATVAGKPVIGLPGYPVSTFLCLRLFVRGIIDLLHGCPSLPPERAFAVLSRPLASRLGVLELVRVKLGRVGDKLLATPSGRGAGAVMSLVQADGILAIPPGAEGIGAGETVEVELLRPQHEVENTLVMIGSHDNALDVIANLLHRQRPYCRLASAHVGSLGGIMAIRRGEAHCAGSHLLDEASGEFNVPYLERHLPGLPLVLVNLAFRQQGLLVRPGNPLGITGFADLVRPEVRFINRQRGAGTRLLTDLHLKRLAIEPAAVAGYQREEYTHMAVASAVATGAADTGLAIRAAAVALGLDFLPVAEERYDLIIPKAHLAEAKVQALLAILRESRELRQTLASLGGYDLRDCGRIVYEQ
ncbi:MAG: molybdopterin biosynthesis protein [Thermodesulfobacteriota bacterium]